MLIKQQTLCYIESDNTVPTKKTYVNRSCLTKQAYRTLHLLTAEWCLDSAGGGVHGSAKQMVKNRKCHVYTHLHLGENVAAAVHHRSLSEHTC